MRGMWILFFLFGSAYAAAVPQVMIRECGVNVGSSNTLLNTALLNLMSFDYVRHTVAQVPAVQPRYCVRGMAVSQNAYLYFRYYIELDVFESFDEKPLARFRFLYQDASVQAHHNVGEKPWVALPPAEADQVWSEFLSQQTLTVTPFNRSVEWSPMAVAEQTSTFKMNKINLPTLSLWEWSQVNGQDRYFMISFMTQTSLNPYSEPALHKAVVLRYASDGTIWARDGAWTGQQLIDRLAVAVERSAREAKSSGLDATAYLLKVSR